MFRIGAHPSYVAELDAGSCTPSITWSTDAGTVDGSLIIPDSVVVTASYDGKLRWWNVKDNTLIHEVYVPGKISEKAQYKAAAAYVNKQNEYEGTWGNYDEDSEDEMDYSLPPALPPKKKVEDPMDIFRINPVKEVSKKSNEQKREKEKQNSGWEVVELDDSKKNRNRQNTPKEEWPDLVKGSDNRNVWNHRGGNDHPQHGRWNGGGGGGDSSLPTSVSNIRIPRFDPRTLPTSGPGQKGIMFKGVYFGKISQNHMPFLASMNGNSFTVAMRWFVDNYSTGEGVYVFSGYGAMDKRGFSYLLCSKTMKDGKSNYAVFVYNKEGGLVAQKLPHEEMYKDIKFYTPSQETFTESMQEDCGLLYEEDSFCFKYNGMLYEQIYQPDYWKNPDTKEHLERTVPFLVEIHDLHFRFWNSEDKKAFYWSGFMCMDTSSHQAYYLMTDDQEMEGNLMELVFDWDGLVAMRTEGQPFFKYVNYYVRRTAAHMTKYKVDAREVKERDGSKKKVLTLDNKDVKAHLLTYARITTGVMVQGENGIMIQEADDDPEYHKYQITILCEGRLDMTKLMTTSFVEKKESSLQIPNRENIDGTDVGMLICTKCNMRITPERESFYCFLGAPFNIADEVGKTDLREVLNRRLTKVIDLRKTTYILEDKHNYVTEFIEFTESALKMKKIDKAEFERCEDRYFRAISWMRTGGIEIKSMAKVSVMQKVYDGFSKQMSQYVSVIKKIDASCYAKKSEKDWVQTSFLKEYSEVCAKIRSAKYFMETFVERIRRQYERIIRRRIELSNNVLATIETINEKTRLIGEENELQDSKYTEQLVQEEVDRYNAEVELHKNELVDAYELIKNRVDKIMTRIRTLDELDHQLNLLLKNQITRITEFKKVQGISEKLEKAENNDLNALGKKLNYLQKIINDAIDVNVSNMEMEATGLPNTFEMDIINLKTKALETASNTRETMSSIMKRYENLYEHKFKRALLKFQEFVVEFRKEIGHELIPRVDGKYYFNASHDADIRNLDDGVKEIQDLCAIGLRQSTSDDEKERTWEKLEMVSEDFYKKCNELKAQFKALREKAKMLLYQQEDGREDDSADNAQAAIEEAVKLSNTVFLWDISYVRGGACGSGTNTIFLSTNGGTASGRDSGNMDHILLSSPEQHETSDDDDNEIKISVADARSKSLRKYVILIETKTKDCVFKEYSKVDENGFVVHHLLVKCRDSKFATFDPSIEDQKLRFGGYRMIVDSVASEDEMEAYKQQLLNSPEFAGNFNNNMFPSDQKYIYIKTFKGSDETILSGDQEDAKPETWKLTENHYRMSHYKNSLECVKMSTNGTRLAVGTWGGMCLVFSSGLPLKDGKIGKVDKEHQLQGHLGSVTCVAWSKDDVYIATGSKDTSIRIWDAANGKQLAILLGHVGYLQRLAWCPKRNILASGGYSTSWDKALIVRLWKMNGWNPYNKDNQVDLYNKSMLIRVDASKDVLGLAWSPTGKHLAISCREVYPYIFKVGDRECTDETNKKFQHEPKSHIHGISWSSDGKSIVTGGSDRSVKQWDISTGQKLFEAKHVHHNQIWGLECSPNGFLIATCSEDGISRVFNAKGGSIDMEIKYHSLKPREKHQYGAHEEEDDDDDSHPGDNANKSQRNNDSRSTKKGHGGEQSRGNRGGDRMQED
jgi:WD40 repeat protein